MFRTYSDLTSFSVMSTIQPPDMKKVVDWSCHAHSILSNTPATYIIQNHNIYNIQHTQYTIYNIHNIQYTTYTIYNIQHTIFFYKQLKTNSAAGPDSLPPIFYRNAQHSLKYPLTILFRNCIDLHELPNEWKFSIITPKFKSGSHHFHPITALLH